MTADVSTIYLVDAATDQAVEAQLRDAIEQAQLDDWDNLWQPELNRLLLQLTRANVPRSQWPQSAHWNWPKKMARVQGLLEFRGFSVIAQGVTQGLMQIDLNASARDPGQAGKALVYVDYLEVAPWNRPDFGNKPRLFGVGSALLSAAIRFSQNEGFKGRIGLHSLPQADGFYRKVGMIELGADSQTQNLNYFEMTAEQAQAFLGEE